MQHQASAHHVAQGSVRLYPIPGHAQFLGQLLPTGFRMLGNQLSNEMQVGFVNDSLPVPEFLLHHRQCSSPAPGTQDLFPA
jgi:hypothetical protein